jgi:dsRNA-specific ribonuclease
LLIINQNCKNIVKKKYKILPIYKLISQEGPEHQKKFQVALYIKDEKISTGEGRSKKEAEQNAAKNAINKLKL